MKDKAPLVAEGCVACPNCAAEVPEIEGFRPWCGCGWNLTPSVRQVESYTDHVYAEISSWRGRGIRESFQAGNGGHRGRSPARILLFLLSVLTNSSFLVALVAGVSVFLFLPLNLITFFVGAPLVGMAWVVRPRLAVEPEVLSTRSECPGLWDLVDRVSGALGVEPPEGLEVQEDFNACVWRCGFSQKRILTLGLPLLWVLDKQERVAIVAHEMSHFANGDPARGALVATALRSLEAWYEVLYPDELWPANPYLNFFEKLGMAIGNLILFAVAQIPRLVLWVAVHLHWDDSQFAEYHADRLAARVSGVAAFESALVKLNLDSHFRSLVQKNTIREDRRGIFVEMEEYVDTLPEREMERLRVLTEFEETSLDRSHPPTSWRREMVLRMEPGEPPSVDLPEATNDRIESELRALSPGVETALVEAYRESLYFS